MSRQTNGCLQRLIFVSVVKREVSPEATNIDLLFLLVAPKCV